MTTIVRHLKSRPPHWWERHSRLWVEIRIPGAEPFTTIVRGGGKTALSRELATRFGITDWEWAK